MCNRCDWCASSRETLCENSGGLIGVAVDGAFADYVVLPNTNLVRIPDGVDLRDAGIVGDAIATPYHVMAERLRGCAPASGWRKSVPAAGSASTSCR